MKKTFTLLTLFLAMSVQLFAVSGITVAFNRNGTTAGDVTMSVSDMNGAGIEGASASMTSSHAFKPTASAITQAIVCPNVNANTNPQITLTFTISGVPAGFSFDKIGLDIHALNGANNYQENNDNVTRQWNVAVRQGATADALSSYGSLDNIDIAAGIGSSGAVHKVWEVSNSTVNCDGSVVIELTITKGSTNLGCFFGLSQIQLISNSTDPNPNPEPEPEPEPEPTPDDSNAKIYNIVWKNTGVNYITEGNDGYMTIAAYDVTKYQFWKFIPTENENCYYIQNTATGNYMGSCNLVPSSASRVTTQSTPVEYYVAPTVATSGEIAGCYYFSSTDCSDYNSENNGPRALNKDGASDYIITWQAGTSRVGSYWRLIETTDLYEVRPYDASDAIGSITTSYYIESLNGMNVTLGENAVALQESDMFDTAQEWYFVGSNNANGWQIASVQSPATVIGDNGTAGEGTDAKWKVHASTETPGYFYFTKHDDDNTTLTIDGQSLFRFKKLRSQYARKMQIYNNPCGIAGNNYITEATIQGDGIIETLEYNASAKPSRWHVVYAHDKAIVAKNKAFDIDLTLWADAAADMTVIAFFDWDCNGDFETKEQFTVNGKNCTASVSVPEWAGDKQCRMRIRLNSNGLDLAEDDVEGFVYDFMIQASEAQEKCTVTVSANSWERGIVVLSQEGNSYDYGTQLTATATAIGNGTFICWREGSIVVSTDAEYTFTADHNVALTAYFSPNTDEDSWTGINEVAQAGDVQINQQGNTINATSSSEIRGMEIYNIDASLVAKSSANKIEVGNLSAGIYIVRVVTTSGSKNIKFYLSK